MSDFYAIHGETLLKDSIKRIIDADLQSYIRHDDGSVTAIFYGAILNRYLFLDLNRDFEITAIHDSHSSPGEAILPISLNSAFAKILNHYFEMDKSDFASKYALEEDDDEAVRLATLLIQDLIADISQISALREQLFKPRNTLGEDLESVYDNSFTFCECELDVLDFKIFKNGHIEVTVDSEPFVDFTLESDYSADIDITLSYFEDGSDELKELNDSIRIYNDEGEVSVFIGDVEWVFELDKLASFDSYTLSFTQQELLETVLLFESDDEKLEDKKEDSKVEFELDFSKILDYIAPKLEELKKQYAFVDLFRQLLK